MQISTLSHDHRPTTDRAYIPPQNFSLGKKLDVPESRSVEFKAGPGFINNGFHNNVGKYVCGFINSNENGTLLLGVDDSGVVNGCCLSSCEEDRIRRQIDEAVKNISPDVFPKDYSLRFVPVHDDYENRIDSRYVIELSVFGSNFRGKHRLYESKQGVFLRRDGSLEGPLTATKIQEWTWRMLETEMENMIKNARNRESKKLLKNVRNKEKELENQKSEIDRKWKELELKEKAMEKREREHNLLKDELRKRNSEITELKAKIKELEQSINTKSQASDETLKLLNDIKQLLVQKNNQKLILCSIM